jgi:hypothetical protein
VDNLGSCILTNLAICTGHLVLLGSEVKEVMRETRNS